MFKRVINKYPCVGPTGRRCFMNGRTPPQHFGNPEHIPPTYNETISSPKSVGSEDSSSAGQFPPSFQNASSKNDRTIRDIASLLAMCALTYFAIDNYANRIRLEKLNIETTAINLKTLQAQQANFLNARKKRDLQILQERKDQDKRNFKMGLHIAFLRKQLVDLRVKPVDIDVAIKEFEKSVWADNSIKNVSGQSLWLDDNSPLKLYLPDSHDYDKKKIEGNSKE